MKIYREEGRSIRFWFPSIRCNLFIMWKDYSNKKCHHISFYRITKGGEHFGFNELRRKVRRFFKRLIHLKEVHRLEKEIQFKFDNCQDICLDPMNGCPGDFAEEYSRQITNLERKLHKLIS